MRILGPIEGALLTQGACLVTRHTQIWPNAFRKNAVA
jgi:hypothetical protein